MLRRVSLDMILTFLLKTTPLARTFNCAVMGPREAAYDTETLYGGADHRCTAPLNFGKVESCF